MEHEPAGRMSDDRRTPSRPWITAALAAAVALGCGGGGAPGPAPAPSAGSPCYLRQATRIEESSSMAVLTTRRFTSAQFWSAVERTAAAPAFRVTPVGRSMQGRPIRAITFGSGPTTVFLWSQMHGD